MALFNYECDEVKHIIDEVSPNYPQLTTYEKEWLYFHKYGYIPGIPVELEYETINVNPTGIVSNAIPFPYKTAILKGNTKYRDIDTGDILDTFDETKNLELVSVQMPVLTTTGKNLFNYSVDNVYTNSSNSNYTPVLNEDGSITINSCYDEPYWLRKGFYVEKGKQYTVTVTAMKNENEYSALSFGFDNLNYFDGGVGKVLIVSDIGGNCINTIGTYGTQKIICTALETGYITRFYIHSPGLTTRYTILEFQIEEGSTATSYEPFKSNILTVNEAVELRGFGNVKDELNLLTGELTERIGEVVLDGSEDETWIFWNSNVADVTGFYLDNQIHDTFALHQLVLCERLPSIQVGITDFNAENIFISSSKRINLNISNTKATSVNELRNYLSQNPLTVQYLLATESIKTVGLTPLNKPYEGTNHYHITSDIPCEAILEVPVVSTGKQTLKDINN